MNLKPLEVERIQLPLLIKLKGDHGKHVLFILKSAGRKLGAQLVKFDPGMAQLLEQH